jgi:hypothetical protein
VVAAPVAAVRCCAGAYVLPDRKPPPIGCRQWASAVNSGVVWTLVPHASGTLKCPVSLREAAILGLVTADWATTGPTSLSARTDRRCWSGGRNQGDCMYLSVAIGDFELFY